MTPRFESVLVPLDGSEVAEQALAVGASLARRAGVPIHLVSVQEPVPAAVVAEIGEYRGDLERESREELSRYLSRIVDATRETQGLAVHSEVIDGPAADALADYVARHGIGLVVMTTHARRGVARWWLGSVADALLRRLSTPVLLLHPSELPQPTRFRRFVVALDGTIEDPVLEPTLALGALEQQPEYILLRVAEPPIPVLSTLAASPPVLGRPHAEPSVEDRAREYLELTTCRLRARGHDVTWRVVVSRDVAEQIASLARTAGADCIAVGTHGARGVERLVLGSVAEKIVREAELPVLVGPVGHAAGGR